MTELGKFLIFAGAIIVVAGVLVLVVGRTGAPIGRLPGDFVWRGKHSVVYFPLATSIVLSIFLSLVFYVFSRFSR
jgi:DUF2905 family protein